MKALRFKARRFRVRLLVAACVAMIGLDVADARLSAEQVPPVGDAPGQKEQAAAELVDRLSSPSFPEREAAAKALRTLGSKAVPALNAGLSGKSLEGVQRCKRVLADIRKDELERFLKVFAADSDRKAKFDHPVWKRWAKVVGDDNNSRELLTEVLAVAGAAETLDQLEADPKAAAALYPAELGRLHAIAASRTRGPDGRHRRSTSSCYSLGEAVFGVYLGSYSGATSIEPDIGPAGWPNDPEMEALESVCNLHHRKRGPFSDAAVDKGEYQAGNLPLDGPKNRILIAMLGNLKGPRTIDFGLRRYGGLTDADLSVCLPLARMVCRDKTLPIEVRAASWPYLAEAGETDFLADMAAGQTDTTRVQQFWRSDEGKREYLVLVSDVSIAAQLLMHKQLLKEFGFIAKLNETGRVVDRSCFAFGFPNDITRKATHAKALAFLAKAPILKPKAPK